MIMIEQFLHNIGLSEKETAVYLTLLRGGNMNAADIAEHTNVKRTTVYPVVETLKEKKLVGEIKEGAKTLFFAEPPERLRSYFQDRKTSFEEQEKNFDDFLPRIRGLQSMQGTQPVFKYYEGREGVLDSIRDMLETESADNEMRMTYSQDFVENFFTPKEAELARGLRLKKDIAVTSIYSWSKGDKPQSEKSVRERITDTKKYPLSCDITIYGDKIRMYTGGDKIFALIIKSKEIAETLKTLHKLAFERLNEKK